MHSARERTHAPLRVNNKIKVGPRYLTFTALASFTAIDQPQTQRWSAADRAKLDAFDTVADAAVRDQHNEIWQLDTDFSCFAAGDRTAIVRLHTATVRSTALADYTAFGEA